jgi:hypothetical protein
MFRSHAFCLKIFLAVILTVSLLAGCAASGSGQQPAPNGYPLVSVSKNGSETSYIYKAANQSVPEVAQKLSTQKKPDQVSRNDNRQMFLAYPGELYNLQKDSKHPANTLIEVSNKAFVRDHYSSSFLKGYLSAVLLDRLFQLGKNAVGGYRGYTGGYGTSSNRTPGYKPATAADKKVAPPLTKQTTGSIIRRGSQARSTNSLSGTFSKIKNSVTQGIGQAVHSAEQNTGKIFKSNKGQNVGPVFPKNSTIQIPKNNSPPIFNSKSFGRIFKRSK